MSLNRFNSEIGKPLVLPVRLKKFDLIVLSKIFLLIGLTVMSHPFIGCVMTTEQQQRFIKHL